MHLLSLTFSLALFAGCGVVSVTYADISGENSGNAIAPFWDGNHIRVNRIHDPQGLEQVVLAPMAARLAVAKVVATESSATSEKGEECCSPG